MRPARRSVRKPLSSRKLLQWVGRWWWMSSGVHRLDPVGVLALDQLSLELHRRRQFLVLGAELRLEQAELLDLLDPRELAVDPLDLAPDQLAHFGRSGQAR